jgi:hypothetical protein
MEITFMQQIDLERKDRLMLNFSYIFLSFITILYPFSGFGSFQENAQLLALDVFLENT